MKNSYLRKAVKNDVDLLYHWVNDVDVRRNSFHTEEIDYDAHVTWFQDKLTDRNAIIFIYYHNHIPTGQIRLDIHEGVAWIDYSVDRKYRGQGYGRDMISLMEKEIRKDQNVLFIKAKVKLNNMASRVLFEQKQYQKTVKNDYIEYKKKLT